LNGEEAKAERTLAQIRQFRISLTCDLSNRILMPFLGPNVQGVQISPLSKPHLPDTQTHFGAKEIRSTDPRFVCLRLVGFFSTSTPTLNTHINST
jgi:hypothetical protein